jgi:predicted NBD/HSP70 family sugar kinase
MNPPPSPLRLGLDLGGTKIAAALLDARGTLLWSQRMPTPQGDYQGIIVTLVAMRDAARQVIPEAELTVGVCTPGAISPATGCIRNANSVVLNGKPLLTDLQQAMGCPIRMANDADCFALSEATDGAAQGASNAFGVILGTGTGGGIVIRGQLLQGCNAIVGEWGHNPLPWPDADEYPGSSCYCGRRGCIETFLSGPALANHHSQSYGGSLSAQEIAEAASRGKNDCLATMACYCERLAKALASVINLLDPEVIVLGGGLSNITMLYDAVPQRWGRYIFSDSVATRLLPPRHGDASGVRGAAALWNE